MRDWSRASAKVAARRTTGRSRSRAHGRAAPPSCKQRTCSWAAAAGRRRRRCRRSARGFARLGAAEDRDRRGGAASAPPGVLHSARRDGVRPAASARGGGGRTDGSLSARPHALAASTAAATAGPSSDQAASFLGSPRGSRPVDWSIRCPARQRVPSDINALEHGWKDGDTWRAGQDAGTVNTEPLCYFGTTEERTGVSDIDRAALRAIMEGTTTGGTCHNRPNSDLAPAAAPRLAGSGELAQGRGPPGPGPRSPISRSAGRCLDRVVSAAEGRRIDRVPASPIRAPELHAQREVERLSGQAHP
jgi:hypothetical protein